MKTNKDWNFIVGNDIVKIGWVSFKNWRVLGYPRWSWFHSFYLYNRSVFQITFFGVNIGLKIR